MANPSALFESHNLIVIVVKLEELDDDALDGRLVDSRVVTVWGITNQATGHWRKSWRAPQVGGGIPTRSSSYTPSFPSVITPPPGGEVQYTLQQVPAFYYYFRMIINLPSKRI